MIYTFGDSVLDSAKYSGPDTAPIIVARELGDNLIQYAEDGATSADLDRQCRVNRTLELGPGIAMVSVGGNDFLWNTGMTGESRYLLGVRLNRLLLKLKELGIRSYVANVYDPTFGKDDVDFLGIPHNQKRLIRVQYDMMNEEIEGCAKQYGTLVDLHAHFLAGDPSWFAFNIEPSEQGAREVSKCFLAVIRGQS